MVNYSQLNNMDTGKIAKAAEAAGGVSGALSGSGEDVESAAKIPPDMWQGLDADSAADLIKRQAPTLYSGSDKFRTSQRALEDLVTGLDAAKEKLADAHDLLAGTGITISADGTITTPVVDSADEAAENDRKASQARGIIDEALRMANESDAKAVEALKATETVVDPQAIPPGDDPRAVNDWWKKLTPEQQAAYIEQFPQQIGALDGIPATDRDKANRLVLDQAIEDRKRRLAELAGPGAGGPGDMNKAERTRLRDELASLERLRDRISQAPPPLPGGADASDNRYFLLGLDPNGDGKAIVAAGNPDTADNVLTYVPGMGTDLGSISANPAGDDLNRIDRMRGDAHILAPDQRTAAIMWLGYDAPDGLGEASSTRSADAGAGALQNFQDGLRATHEGGPSNNTLLGHSYGSTVVGHAARDGGVNADSLVTAGSPGMGVDNVSELNFDPERVYSTRAENDIIKLVPNTNTVIPVPGTDTAFSGHGLNPADPSFGSNVFDSAPGASGWFGLPTSEAHSQYWDPDNPSRESIGKIIVGRGDEVGN